MEQDKKISLKGMAAASQFNKERDYWLNRFSGELVKSIFPPDFEQPASQNPGVADKNIQTVKFRFDGDFFARLMKLRNGLDSTLHMVLAAGTVLLLAKYTGNNDIIVGTTILKQENDANFINTVLALRNRLESHMTFKDLLLQVRQIIMEAVTHQNYPLEKLLYQLDIPATPGSFPLFDTGVILQNIHERNYFRHINLNILFSF
ncbi:MAG TPA: condensation domain-containing protein, partial [Candidatus Deferrimicrobium sp.]|nr:condensation domain-containing protein [Candidatus Deferrimicrobium sp.]